MCGHPAGSKHRMEDLLAGISRNKVVEASERSSYLWIWRRLPWQRTVRDDKCVLGKLSLLKCSEQILQPGSYLDMTTALGLTPDSSSFKLHINFCCLIAKNFIWICRSKECFPIHNNFLFYLRHIYQLENKTPSNTKKWKPFFSSLGLVS